MSDCSRVFYIKFLEVSYKIKETGLLADVHICSNQPKVWFVG